MNKIWSVVVISLLVCSSCSKETSVEVGQGAKGCQVSGMVVLDSITGQALYALNTLFNPMGKARALEAVDSIAKQIDLSQPFIYSKDSVLLGDGQFVLLDSLSRVKSLQVREDPTDPTSLNFVYTYKYDANGYLSEKTISTLQVPLTLATYTYTWTSGNLTRIEGKINLGLNSVRIFLAEMGYDSSVEPKNFIYIFPDAIESFLFLNALNYGKKNKHLIKSLTVFQYDQQGTQTDKAESTFMNATLNADKYVTQWTIKGDSMDPFGIFTGKMRFDYFCR